MKVVLIPPNKKQDFTTELVVEGLRDLNCRLLASDEGNGILQNEVLDEHSLVEEAKTADAVLFFFGKVKGNLPPKHYLIDRLKDRRRCAYIDGSEWTSTGYQEKDQGKNSLIDPSFRRGKSWINVEMRNKCSFYFKRECYPQDEKQGLLPLPFGLLKRNISQKEVHKDIDVACIFGHTTTGLRKEVMEACEKLKKNSNHRILVDSKIPQQDYLATLARSRIVIDAWGGGDNCNRFYEAIGSKSCCLYQKYNTVVPNPFVHMQHAVCYENLQQFTDTLQVLLENFSLCKQIGDNGHEHAIKNHSAICRAKFVLNTILESC